MKLLQIAISISIFMVLCHSTNNKTRSNSPCKAHKKKREDMYRHMVVNENPKNLDRFEQFPKNVDRLDQFLTRYVLEDENEDEIKKSKNEKEKDNTIERLKNESLKNAMEKLANVKVANKNLMTMIKHGNMGLRKLHGEEINQLENKKQEEINQLKKETKEEISQLKNEIEMMSAKLHNAKDANKKLITEINNLTKSHGEEINLNNKLINILKNEKQELFAQENNIKKEKEEEISQLKNEIEIMSAKLHDVHVNYIIGIIIGSIVILGFFCYFYCFKPDKTKVKNEIKDLDIEAYGELSLSQVPIAPGVLATKGEGSISFSIAIGRMPEMLVATEEYEISADKITEIKMDGEKEQEEGIPLDLKEIQI